ncbi:hypothetical protein DL767_001391 [Monosporascus sp. MG133]|nr:hypothetical protein DL767_001391 [Monosporascus sp. MG133]
MRKLLLEELWKMMASESPSHIFSIYLAVFMFLHETSLINRDRYRWARVNGLEELYSLPDQFEAVQEGANIVLSHWHYYKRGFEPLRTDWQKGEKAIRAQLKTKEREHLVEMCRYYEERGKALSRRPAITFRRELKQK